EIGRVVRASGYAVAVPPMMVKNCCSEASAAELIRHELRWGRTIRGVNPGGYAASIVTHGTALGLIGCLITGFALVPVTALVCALACRAALVMRLNTLFGIRDPIWLVPFRDLLSFMVFIGALFTTRVDWRGVRF